MYKDANGEQKVLQLCGEEHLAEGEDKANGGGHDSKDASIGQSGDDIRRVDAISLA